MRQLYIKQKMFSLSGKFSVKDEQEKEKDRSYHSSRNEIRRYIRVRYGKQKHLILNFEHFDHATSS